MLKIFSAITELTQMFRTHCSLSRLTLRQLRNLKKNCPVNLRQYTLSLGEGTKPNANHTTSLGQKLTPVMTPRYTVTPCAGLIQQNF